MAKFNRQQIQSKALELLGASPDGIRYAELVKLIHASTPETPVNSVHGALQDLKTKTEKVTIPTKGLWQVKFTGSKALTKTKTSARRSSASVPPSSNTLPVKLNEVDFYAPLADWLRDGADEVTEAVPLGGASMKDRWGTPDVLGIIKPKTGDFVPFPLEIAAVEVKIDPTQSITAFGQACAYRIFSHRVYLAMPQTIGKEDRDRLEALCVLYGIALILFDSNPKDPKFQLVVRAARHTPDMFFANQFARKLHDAHPKIFHKLF
jgi:hypothetical protein